MSNRCGKPGLLPAWVLAGLAALPGLGCCQSGGGGEPACPPAHIHWLKGAARPFATVDPKAKDDDLAILDSMVGGAAIVGLGEATHGSSEFFRMKHRTLRYLVERQGFTAFGLEADMALCWALDNHVLTGAGDPRALVRDLGMWVWATEEVVDLVAWMRAYNADPAHPDKLRFFGFDMQDGTAAIDHLTAYLAAVDPASTIPRALAMYRPFTGIRDPLRLPYCLAPREHRALCRENLLEVQRRLAERRDGYIAVRGVDAYEWALQMAELLVQHEACGSAEEYPHTLMAVNFRDRFMADNAEWAIRRLRPGTRTVLWAHNGHVNRKGAAAPLWTNTGDWLAQRRGAGYLSVGFAFGAGSSNAIPVTLDGGPGVLQPCRLPPTSDGSYEAAFLQAGFDLAVLDLRRLDLTLPGALWFSQPHPFRELGTVFNATIAQETATSLVDRFDILVFLRTVSPSKLLGQGAGGR